MNLNGLREQLPTEVDLEKELANQFRAAALSITGLFQQGKKLSKKAYLAGKREALADVLEFLQTGLDANGSNNSLNVERFINYICARQETLKAEDEADGEEENDQPPRPSTSASRGAAPTVFSAPRSTASHLPARSATVPNLIPPPAVAQRLAQQQQHQTTPRESPRQEPMASSSSSAPVSPQAYHPSPAPSHSLSSSSSFSPSLINAGPQLSFSSPLFSPNSAAGVTSSGGVVPSPLTRLQARREREHRKGKNNSNVLTSSSSSSRDRSSLSSTVNGGLEPMMVGEGGVVMGGGNLKRRWTTTVNTTAVELDETMGASDSVHEGDNYGRMQQQQDEGGEMMEMEGWDGVGERPFKRTSRR